MKKVDDPLSIQTRKEEIPLSRLELYLLALASAAVTANAYYIHPIIARVAQDFNVSATVIGIVPALNQIALATGIFLLLPLGDRLNNRRLCFIFVLGQFFAITAMAIVPDFALFAVASTILGFFTITPYLLPAYVSRRVPPSQIGHATATLTTGVIGGILVARAGAGFLGEHVGWRSVYFVASTLMLVFSIVLPRIMKKEENQQKTHFSYPDLLLSIIPLVKKHPDIITAGLVQAMSFGIFLSVWLGLGLHLTGPDMGYGVDTVGYLAALSAINLIATPSMGTWADKFGARRARATMAFFQLCSVTLLFFLGHSLWLLLVPLLLMTLVGPLIDVTGRMTFLNQAPAIRTRLMTVYIVFMFVGGGVASWAGTTAYDLAGWRGNITFSLLLSILVFCLSVWSYRRSL